MSRNLNRRKTLLLHKEGVIKPSSINGAGALEQRIKGNNYGEEALEELRRE
jgi:hypothetical protein